MRREFRESKKSKPVRVQPRVAPAWFWMFLGFLPGLILAILTYLDKHDPRAASAQTRPAAIQNTVQNNIDKSAAKVPVSTNTSNSKGKTLTKVNEDVEYTFFTELPKLEVVVSEQDVVKDAKLHQQKTLSSRKEKSHEKSKDKGIDKQSIPVSQDEPNDSIKAEPVKKTLINEKRPKPLATKTNSDTSVAPTISAPLEHRYILQAGSFKKQVQAEQRQAQLAKAGIQAHIENIDIKGDSWYRVRIGPFDDYKQIQSHLEILKQHSISAITVKLK